MVPAKRDITIVRGDTVTIFMRLRLRNVDGSLGAYQNLTGATAKSQIRPNTTDNNTPLAEFTATLSDQNTTPGGFLLKLTSTQTRAINVQQAVYDVQITEANGDVTTYLKGAIIVEDDVTR